MAAWFLGDAEISIQSSFTGRALRESVYQVDINLDGQFDEKDTLADGNLYKLTSPVNPCGNLIPAIFKYSHSVTLLGQTSGGGSCSVLGLTTLTATSSRFRACTICPTSRTDSITR